MYLGQKDSAKSIGSSDEIQQLMLQMKNLSSTMENLLLLLHKSMPKIFDSGSDSKPAVTGNNRNVAPVVPPNDGWAGKTILWTYSIFFSEKEKIGLIIVAYM